MSITSRVQRLAHLERGIRRGEAVQTRVQQAGSRLGWWRLWVFLGTVGGGLALLQAQASPWMSVGCGAVGLTIFAVLVGRNRRVNAVLERCRLWLDIQQMHVARSQLDWAHIPPAPAFKQDPEHPFENDFDLTGERSLLQLLDTTATLQGSKLLHDWLLATTPDEPAIRERHQRLDEISPAFADRLSLMARLGSQVRQLDTRQLSKWLADVPESAITGRYLLVLVGICVVTGVLYGLYRTASMPPLFIGSLVLYLGLSVWRGREALVVLNEAFDVQYALSGVQGVFRFLETRHYEDKPALKSLCQPFLGATRPSAELRELGVIIGMAAMRNNAPVWLLLNLLMPWDLYTTYRMNKLRHKLARLMPDWLTTWHTLEALAALRLFGYLNPEYTRPEWSDEGMVFEAQALGHPLLGHAQRVNNDFTMNTAQVTMITGSNMSGKSSFLRTMGINIVLANAGTVVSAKRLRLSHYRLFACIKVNDSLADGYSYFYAEVRRLKALLNALDSKTRYPLFYLIDEIFKGTNNRERLLGSEAFIKALVGKHGTGAISTHDLELATMTHLSNFHFSDDVEAGQLSFDYQLRAGVSPTTNALRIMRLAGLPTPE